MQKVRLQAVVSTVVANRLKEEAERRGTSVSALLATAAEQFLAPKKAPPLPTQRYVTEREFVELKAKMDMLLGGSPLPLVALRQEVSEAPIPRVSSGLYTRTRVG